MAESHYRLGNAYDLSGDPANARVEFEKVLQLAPDESFGVDAQRWLDATP